jgi:hypothetical protein
VVRRYKGINFHYIYNYFHFILMGKTLITQFPNIRRVIFGYFLIVIYSLYNIFISVSLGGASFCSVILFPILKGGIADREKIDYYFYYYCSVYILFDWAAVSLMVRFIRMVTEISFSFSLSEFVLLAFFDFYLWILLSVWGILNSSIIVIYASRS